jgi:GNAT superfamily N-acetyltransferase
MDDIQIELIQPGQVDEVIELFTRHIYEGDRNQAVAHLAGHHEGEADTFVAYAGKILAGFLTIRWHSDYPGFRDQNIPLIHQMEVFPTFQRRGIASQLMERAEQLIAMRARQAGICVGLFDAYGPAQRLYAKRGYVPDGQGACQAQRPLKYGETVTLTHDLIIWMIKELEPPR